MIADVILTVAMVTVAPGAIAEFQFGIRFVGTAANRALVAEISRLRLGRTEGDAAGLGSGLLCGVFTATLDSPGVGKQIGDIPPHKQQIVGNSHQGEQIVGEAVDGEGQREDPHKGQHQIHQREDPGLHRDDEEQQEMGIREHSGIAQEQAEVQIAYICPSAEKEAVDVHHDHTGEVEEIKLVKLGHDRLMIVILADNGIIKENPTFVLMLGMCPTLAVTSSAMNGLGMGLTTAVVLTLSNMMISALRKVIPDKVRIPAYIVIIASFVTVVQLLLQGFIPSLYDALGIYIPLIVVNCIILGRAEAFASKNSVILSIFDGLGMGLGFAIALTLIGAVREILGAGELFGLAILPVEEPIMLGSFALKFEPIRIFGLAPGAFFVVALLTAIQNKVKKSMEEKGKNAEKIQSGCNFDCASCGDSGCSHKFYDAQAGEKKEEVKEEK